MIAIVAEVKYDVGQKVYAYDRNEIIECFISRISISKNGVYYCTEREERVPGAFSIETRYKYDEYPQEQVFAKRSEAIAYAIKVKNAQLQDTIRMFGIDKLKKELEEELKKEEKGNANTKSPIHRQP